MRRFSDSQGSTLLSETVLEPEIPTLAISNKDIGWHMTSNPSPDRVALSLHLYTPPMLECVHSKGVAPVVYCEKGITRTSSSQAMLSPLKLKESAKVHACASVFSNFQMLVEMLWSAFDGQAGSPSPQIMDELIDTLTKVEFNVKEIDQYKSMNGTAYVRRRLALHPCFEVFIVSWKAGEVSPIHDHGGSSAICKVLEGTLLDEHYSKPERNHPPYVVQSSLLKRNEVASYGPETIHRTSVTKEADCCCLLIFAPSYDQCCNFCPKTGACTLVQVSNSEL